MNNAILVAGATGNLGGKITDALLAKGVDVRAIVRTDTDAGKIKKLQNKGVSIFHVTMKSKDEIVKACANVNCVVSALSGLQEVIIDTQKILLEAAIDAGVPRFIPSDYSIDFTNLKEGKNRNLDLRKEFHKYLVGAPIQATTIFNGVFMDLLTGDMPLILYKQKRILYWGNPDVKMDMTATYNVAEFVAGAALDNTTPRYLYIAGDSVSAVDVMNTMTDMSGTSFRLFKAGSIGLLNVIIKIAKAFSFDKTNLYPAWQGMQYMRDMMEGRAVIELHDNNRYPGISWTSVKEFLLSEGAQQKIGN